MTRRERLERKAEKRREWAAGREAKSEAAMTESHRRMDQIPYERSQAIPYPSYALTNLGARIRDAKQRAARIEREQAAAAAGQRLGGRMMQARYGGECADCGGRIEKGDTMIWYRTTREAVHATCPAKEEAA